MNKKISRRKKSGFTLTEVLIAVSIIVVMAAVSVPAVSALIQNFRFHNLDAAAQQIYLSAQNRLTSLRFSGEEASAGGNKITVKPVDFDDSKADFEVQKESFYYVADGEASALFPEGALDETVAEGHYIVEYNRKTGTVYSVFYSESALSYEADILTMTERTLGYRKTLQKEIGYYGASDIEIPETENVLTPEIRLINGETLYVEIEKNKDRNYIYTVEISGENATKTYRLAGASSDDVLLNENITYSGGKFTIILDKLADNLHFSDNFSSSDGFVPGENIMVSVTVSDETGEQAPVTVTAKTNSLFALFKDGSADIAAVRHLQNLSTGESSVPANYVYKAVQTKALDFNNSDESVFRPIFNFSLMSYDGYGNVLSNFKIDDSKNENSIGLFSEFGSSSKASAVKNVRIVNPNVSASKANFAGAFSGKIENCDISDCLVYADPAALSDLSDAAVSASFNSSASHFAGAFAGEIKNGTIKYSAASLPLIDVSTSGEGTLFAGGFAGSESAEVSFSYANTALINVSSPDTKAYAAGFAGRVSGNVTGSYAVGKISADGKASACGFAAASASVGNKFENCYSAVEFDLKSDSALSFGFVSNSGVDADYIDCVCLSGMGYTASGSDDIKVSSLSDINSAFKNTAGFTSANEATTHPYSLSGAYILPRIERIAHYGDWPEAASDNRFAQIVYYELYRMKNGRYQLGFYSEDIKTAGGFLNTLLGESDYSDLVSDGYSLFYIEDDDKSTCRGVSYNNLFSDKYSFHSWYRANSTNSNTNWLKKPSEFTVNGTVVDVYYEGSVLQDEKTLTISGISYYPAFLANAYVVDDVSNRENTFYQSLKISLNSAGNKGQGSETYTYYYNPHFAKSKVFVDTAPSEDDITAVIRTERQYATLASSAASKYWNKNITFLQERNLDFSDNK